MDSAILSNQLKCPYCNESIFSTHRHDIQYCECGKCMVDGGMHYLRRSMAGIDESIVISKEDSEGLLRALTDSSKNPLGKLCNIVRYLRDNMGINISYRVYGDDKEAQ